MKTALLFIFGIVLANIVAATFIWPPSTTASGTPKPVVNAATRQGQDPWMVNERYNVDNRERTRKVTLETLDKPWASYCTTEGHELLIRIINNTYGEDAGRYAVKAWTTTDDNRIERLMSETYGRGYFSLDELQSNAREALAGQVKGVHVRARPCAS
jgi:hypothetical protein